MKEIRRRGGKKGGKGHAKAEEANCLLAELKGKIKKKKG